MQFYCFYGKIFVIKDGNNVPFKFLGSSLVSVAKLIHVDPCAVSSVFLGQMIFHNGCICELQSWWDLLYVLSKYVLLDEISL